jgi:hypothetical protein
VTYQSIVIFSTLNPTITYSSGTGQEYIKIANLMSHNEIYITSFARNQPILNTPTMNSYGSRFIEQNIYKAKHWSKFLSFLILSET